jgi:hypothetical protein
MSQVQTGTSNRQLQVTVHGAVDGKSAHVDIGGVVKATSYMRSPIVGIPQFSNLEHRHWLPIVPLTVDRRLLIQVERLRYRSKVKAETVRTKIGQTHPIG